MEKEETDAMEVAAKEIERGKMEKKAQKNESQINNFS